MGNATVIREVVTKHGFDVNFKEDGKNNAGFCAAAFAVVKSRPECLELLASLGADLFAVDKHDQSVRDLAAKKHDVKCLDILDRYAPIEDEELEAQRRLSGKKEAFKMSGWS